MVPNTDADKKDASAAPVDTPEDTPDSEVPEANAVATTIPTAIPISNDPVDSESDDDPFLYKQLAAETAKATQKDQEMLAAEAERKKQEQLVASLAEATTTALESRNPTPLGAALKKIDKKLVDVLPSGEEPGVDLAHLELLMRLRRVQNPGLIVAEIVKDPILWHAFIVEFVFGGAARLVELDNILRGGKCSHIILTRGAAPEVCSALLACGLHDAFACVIDTSGGSYWPNPSYVHDKSVSDAAAFLNSDLLHAAFFPNTTLPPGFRKDTLIKAQTSCMWRGIFPPHTGRPANTPPKKVIYVDDNPEVRDLPPEVVVVHLPSEVKGGITSNAGRKVTRQLGLNWRRLGPTDLVIWDFDCTITSVHLYKTIHMFRSPRWEFVWGQMLMDWWTARSPLPIAPILAQNSRLSAQSVRIVAEAQELFLVLTLRTKVEEDAAAAKSRAKESAQKKMVACARALVTAVAQANKDGLVAPLQQALDDAINTGMPTDCAAAVRARKVLQSLQASERKADVRRGIFLARKHGGNSVESDNEVRMCMGIMLGLCVSRET